MIGEVFGTETSESPVLTFTKEQLLESVAYESRRDLLSVILADGERYTRAEVDDLIQEFMKGKVS